MNYYYKKNLASLTLIVLGVLWLAQPHIQIPRFGQGAAATGTRYDQPELNAPFGKTALLSKVVSNDPKGLADAQANCGIYSITSDVAIFYWEGTAEWSNRSGSPVYRFIISVGKGCPLTLTNVTQPPGFTTTTPLIQVSGPYPTEGQHNFLDGYALDVTTGINPFNSDKIGSATIQVGNGPPFFQWNWPNPFTFRIGNFAKPRCQYFVSSKKTFFEDNGGPGTADVTAIPDPSVPVSSCTWSASANFCSWIKDVSPTSSFGNGSVNFTVLPNVAGGSCSLTIAGEKLSITKSPCTFVVNSQTIRHYTADSQNDSVALNTIDICPWTVSTNVNWITPSVTSGTGARTIGFSLAANPNNYSRTGSLFIAGKTVTVRQFPSQCPVPPLTNITDPDALVFEAGNEINTERLVDDMKSAHTAFKAGIVALNGTFHLDSAWRPKAYQVHFREIWDKWGKLQNNSNPACQELREAIKSEKTKHKIVAQPAGPDGPHTTGNAIDVTITGNLTGTEIFFVAKAAGLCRPFPGPPLLFIDNVHYVLRSMEHRKGECYDPLLQTANLRQVSRQTQSATLPTLAGVTLKVLRQDINGKFVYHYRLMNTSDQIIVAFSVGNNNETPELMELPINWDSHHGTPYESATSPLGWQAGAIAQEESDYHYLHWAVNNPYAASVPGQVLSGFSVTLPSPDDTYTTAAGQVILDDGLVYAVPMEPDDAPLLAPSGQSFLPAGGNGAIALTAQADYNWTAISNDPWISISSQSNGTGDGTVAYSVQANNTSTNRVGTLTVSGRTFTVFQGVQFNDVPSNYLFYNEISKLSARGVTIGCGGGNFCPDQPVTRDQMAAFIIRALGQFTPSFNAAQRFTDVALGNVFYGFIDEMAFRGITVGCAENLYCPTAPVTREQMSAFMVRAMGEFNPPTPVQQRFDDVPPSNIFYPFIERMAQRGITFGCSTTPPRYCPTDPVTRGQMAAFLVRAFGL